MPTFATQMAAADERALIRKIQRAIGFLAPTTVELPTTLYSAGSLIDLKTAGFLPVGMISPDGWSFGRDIEKEDVDALGYASPVRSDTTRVARSVSFTPLEKGRRHLLELQLGMDLSGVTQNPTTGEIVMDEPDLPVNGEYRLLVLGDDGPATENWILGKGFGSVKLASTAEEVWGREGTASSQITLDISTDDEIGTPVRHFIAGTGAVKYKDVLGFTQAVATP
ncbi:MAG: ArV2 [Pseudarthrobacter sp.]|nr:ArV2 [Pseudarthrobacter sp.]